MIRRLLTLLLPVLLPTFALAQEEPSRPRIGVVLGGGGARGAAHIGVLKVLEEERVPIDIIVGTSMGAVVGGLYASGYTADELAELISDVDWGVTLQDVPERARRPMRRKSEDFDLSVRFSVGLSTSGITVPPGMMFGQHLELMFRRMLLRVKDTRDFDELGIPFRAVATDLGTGDAVVIGEGDLVRAIRASMSVPGAFAPTRWNDRLLIDGGVVNNVPVDIARSLGADVVIAVDVGSDIPQVGLEASALSVSLAASQIMLRNRVREVLAELGPDDTLLRIGLEDVSGTQFGRSREVIPLGQSSARESLAGIQQYSVSAESYEAWAERRLTSVEPDLTVVEIDVDDRDAPGSKQLVRARIRQRIGEPLDVDRLERDLDHVYGIGRFALIDYELQSVSGGTRVLIRPLDKPWGPTFLRFGLQLSDDFEGGRNYGVKLETLTYANSRRGREYRTRFQIGSPAAAAAEVYQPLDYGGRFFTRFNAKVEQDEFVARFPTGEPIGTFLISLLQAEAAVGYNLGQTWTLASGVRVGHAWLEGQSGLALAIPDDDVRLGTAFAELSHDTLDDFALPRRGHRLETSYAATTRALGSETTNSRLEGNFNQAISFGRRRFLLGAAAANLADRSSAYGEESVLGGLFRLSGYHNDELIGQDYVLGRLIYYDTVGGGARSMFGFPIILGASIEYGDTWLDGEPWRLAELRWGGSAFAGIDTVLGSLYIAYGHAEAGRQAVYFTFGTLFDIGRGSTLGSL